MQQIIYFIRKFRYLLLFLLLETVAIIITIHDNSYHTSKFVNSANFITGGIYNKINAVNEIFLLKIENKLLIEENVLLKNLLNKKEIKYSLESYKVIDSTLYFQKYEYGDAKIINNNFSKRNNNLTINKGVNHGLIADMGVINGRGIIGVIKNVSSNYATVLSILNSNSKINVRFKNSTHYGTMVWDGKNYYNTQIVDVPRQAIIKEGDTIITGGKSAIFPEGIPIGIIKNFKIKNNQYGDINIVLFNDMSALSHVQIIKNLEKSEQLNLEQKGIDE